MNKLKYDYFVFDFDGTLFDTGDGIIKTAKLALDFYNIDSNKFKDMKFFIGPPLLDSFQKYDGVDQDMAEKLVAKYRAHYRTTGLFDSQIYDGVEKLLLFLKKSGAKIGIGSSKPKSFITELLEYKNMIHLFDEISAVTLNNSHEPKSEIIKRSLENMGCENFTKALMVGDRYFDIDGANEIGVDNIGVLYGYGSEQEFKTHNATYIVNNCQEIVDIIHKN